MQFVNVHMWCDINTALVIRDQIFFLYYTHFLSLSLSCVPMNVWTSACASETTSTSAGANADVCVCAPLQSISIYAHCSVLTCRLHALHVVLLIFFLSFYSVSVSFSLQSTHINRIFTLTYSWNDVKRLLSFVMFRLNVCVCVCVWDVCICGYVYTLCM